MGILLAASIILFSLSLSKKLAGGSIIWTIPLVVCIIIFILAIIIMTSVLTAGIDVKNGIVIFADATGQGGKQPQFNLGQLDRIEYRNAYLLFSSFFISSSLVIVYTISTLRNFCATCQKHLWHEICNVLFL